MEAIAKEFAKRFSHERINKIMTIEASGIAPAIMVGYIMKLPVVFAKKKEPKTMINALTTTVHSFTKDPGISYIHKQRLSHASGLYSLHRRFSRQR